MNSGPWHPHSSSPEGGKAFLPLYRNWRSETPAAMVIVLDPRAAFATRSPDGAHDHVGVIERVIEMDGDSPEVDAANAGNGRLSVEGVRHLEGRDDLERLFEFLGEHVGLVISCSSTSALRRL